MILKSKNTEEQQCMKSNNTLPSRLFVFFLVLLSLTGGFFLWWSQSTLPIDPTDSTVITYQIQKGSSVRQIAADLMKKNLIRSPTAFFILVKLSGLERSLQAGDFRLSKSMDARMIAQSLTHGTSDIWLRTLEGWRVEEVAQEVAKTLDIPTSEFMKFAREGYMFPDSYSMPQDATAGAVVEIFANTFDKKITTEMRNKVASSGLTMEEVIILASIVEREGNSSVDRPIIAGILRKRLEASWPLQVDATLQYALGYQPNEKSWWKKYLTNVDKEIESPFNTYKYVGLPPAPICNPGIEAIEAVINPQESDYWFYIHDTSGTAHYGRTIEEHNANIQKYL